MSELKVIGVGLNKTGTKTLRACLVHMGLRHRTYAPELFDSYARGATDVILAAMNGFDSFEDWPWPLLYREIDARFPQAKFILTVRGSADIWYRSLCKMAIRMGPMDLYEKAVYGHGMPQGRREAHIAYYEAHNAAVRAHFADRPGKLLTVCWETGSTWADIAAFLGRPEPPRPMTHENKTRRNLIYSGDNLVLAQINRVLFQSARAVRDRLSRANN